MQDGSNVLILYNAHDETPVNVTARWVDDLGWPSNTSARVRDLWKRSELGVFVDEFTSSVNPRDVVMIRVYQDS